MKNALLSILICVFAYVFSSCESKDKSSIPISEENIKVERIDLAPADFSAESTKGIILDVRTPSEVASGNIAGSIAMDYSQGNFESQIADLPKDSEIYVYCAVGGRSSKAADLLIQQGFTKVYNLQGGLTAWKEAGLPIITPK